MWSIEINGIELTDQNKKSLAAVGRQLNEVKVAVSYKLISIEYGHEVDQKFLSDV